MAWPGFKPRCVEGSQDHLQVSDSLGFTGISIEPYGYDLRQQTQQRETARGVRKPGAELPEASPRRVTCDALHSPSKELWWYKLNVFIFYLYLLFYQGSSLETQPLTGVWSCRPPTHQNSRLPEGKKVFSINCIIFTNRVHTVSHFYQLENGGNSPEIHVERSQTRASLTNGSL